MMIASPTAASAAATVMTKNTNTCPATPYTCANATNVRFTALSISSTHMKMMIALRRVSTPTTPIVNSTAEKNERLSEHRHVSSRLPSTTAPTMAASSSTLVTSKASRYSLNSGRAIGAIAPDRARPASAAVPAAA